MIREAQPREDVDPMRARVEVATVTLTDPDQVAALAFAALVTREVVRAGAVVANADEIGRASCRERV